MGCWRWWDFEWEFVVNLDREGDNWGLFPSFGGGVVRWWNMVVFWRWDWREFDSTIEYCGGVVIDVVNGGQSGWYLD